MTGSDQATRRAIRTLGHPVEHQTFFAATEGSWWPEITGPWPGSSAATGWGAREDRTLPLPGEHRSLHRLAGGQRRQEPPRQDPPAKRQPTPDPYSLYPTHLQSAIPEPPEQVKTSLAVQLTRAEKEALDLLAAWPLCTTDQLVGLMGGVTRRRANQVLRSLGARSLVRSENQRHVLADDGLRSLDSQLDHQDAITGIAAALSAEVARSDDHHLLELLPTFRSSIGYRYQGADYVIHPDATFWMAYRGDWRPYFLEFERRAVTPRRVRARLKNYPRYFASGWADLDHAGRLPLVLFVFETHDAEESFLRAAGAHRLPICTSNLEIIDDLGVLREVWRWPPPNAPDRLPLHRLGEGYKNVPSRSRHFL